MDQHKLDLVTLQRKKEEDKEEEENKEEKDTKLAGKKLDGIVKWGK